MSPRAAEITQLVFGLNARNAQLTAMMASILALYLLLVRFLRNQRAEQKAPVPATILSFVQ